MTARRSDDPSAREHTEDSASAAQHWTPEHRRAAKPAPFERDLPSKAADEQPSADDANAEGVGTRCAAEEDGDPSATQRSAPRGA